MARPSDVLCARGDGGDHTACPDRRHHPAPHRRLHAAMRPAAHRSLRGNSSLDKRYLIHDRERSSSRPSRAAENQWRGAVLLPPRSPNLNAYCERFVRSIKEEALDRMVILGKQSLYYAIHQYLIHYHMERNHQGLDNQLIAPEPDMRCPVKCGVAIASVGCWAISIATQRDARYDRSPSRMPTMNVHAFYEQTIKSLPASERLRLAVLILNDIRPSPWSMCESWTRKTCRNLPKGAGSISISV